MTDAQLDSALDLMRRMSPQNIEDNLANIIDLVPDLTESLLGAVDQPLKLAKDTEAGKDFVICDYNRDGDSYRSPWTNKYYDPPLPDGTLPSDRLRELETSANEVFDQYRELYYEGGVSSVYFWDIDDNHFAACFLIKKDGEARRGLDGGVWNSIHVVDVIEVGNKAVYKLTTTIMLSLKAQPTKSEFGTNLSSLSGSLTRQTEQESAIKPESANESHLVNIGRMIEDMELKLRNTLDQIYFGKTREVTDALRKEQLAADRARDSMQRNMIAEMAAKKK